MYSANTFGPLTWLGFIIEDKLHNMSIVPLMPQMIVDGISLLWVHGEESGFFFMLASLFKVVGWLDLISDKTDCIFILLFYYHQFYLY